MNINYKKTIQRKNYYPEYQIQKEQSTGGTARFVDNRPETVHQRKLIDVMKNGRPKTLQQQKLHEAMAHSPGNPVKSKPRKEIQKDTSGKATVQRKANTTGLPDNLKAGVENLSGYAMDDVKVHYNSRKPAQLQAHAYAQGTDIHLAPGQEKHLPHEAWHVVQQKQGRVKPTIQMKGKQNINDDARLEKEADVMGIKSENTSVTTRTSGNRDYRKPKTEVIQLTGEPTEARQQRAGTCGLYSLAHTVSWLYNLKGKEMDIVVTLMLEAGGKVDAHITAEGEVVTFEDAEAIVEEYNKSTEAYKIQLERRKVTNSTKKAGNWRKDLGTKGKAKDDAIMIAIDDDIWEQEKRNKYKRVKTRNTTKFKINGKTHFTINGNICTYTRAGLKEAINTGKGSGAHWVMIVEITNKYIAFLDPNRPGTEVRVRTEDAHLLSTSLPEGIPKGDYLNEVYGKTKGRQNSALTWVEGMLRDEKNGGNADWKTMFPDGDIEQRGITVAERLDNEQGRQKILDLKGLAIKVTKKTS